MVLYFQGGWRSSTLHCTEPGLVGLRGCCLVRTDICNAIVSESGDCDMMYVCSWFAVAGEFPTCPAPTGAFAFQVVNDTHEEMNIFFAVDVR